jgi:hypothetical protein
MSSRRLALLLLHGLVALVSMECWYAMVLDAVGLADHTANCPGRFPDLREAHNEV